MSDGIFTNPHYDNMLATLSLYLDLLSSIGTLSPYIMMINILWQAGLICHGLLVMLTLSTIIIKLKALSKTVA